MTEIQFLAQLILNDSISADVKKQLVDRIVELENQKIYPSIAVPYTTINPIYIGPAPDLCNHEYPNPWGATVPPHCKKCGKQADAYLASWGANGSLAVVK